MEVVNLSQKLSLINDHWNPRIVGELNGQHVKLAKFKGPFIFHKHDNEDEMFLVIKGQFTMEYRDHSVVVKEGEFLIVPKGVEHCPVAEEEVEVMLFEPGTTVNTGQIQNERTVNKLEKL